MVLNEMRDQVNESQRSIEGAHFDSIDKNRVKMSKQSAFIYRKEPRRKGFGMQIHRGSVSSEKRHLAHSTERGPRI